MAAPYGFLTCAILSHPQLADVWRTEIMELRDALTEDRCDPEARRTVRNMVEEIRLTPARRLVCC